MKKIFVCAILAVLVISTIIVNKVLALQNVQMKDSDYAKNMYSPAFPLVYEDLKNEIVKGKVEFVGYHSSMIDVLDSLDSPENRLSEEFYYKIIAKRTPEYKRKIEYDIKKKFNEKSSILDMISWKPGDERDIVLYSIVKKNVEFLKYFEILEPMSFNNSKIDVKYFGTKDKSRFFKTQIKPLFYKDENNYAVSLKTKTGDEVILYTGDFKDKTVHQIWGDLNKKIKPDSFKNDDKFLAPFIDIKQLISYDNFAGKEIKGTDYKIAKAIESVEFSLDNKGAKLKNEAMIMMETCALRPDVQQRYFYFDKPFVLFMKEEGHSLPYFMVKIEDTKYLVKP